MKQPQPSLTASYSLVQSSFWMNFCTAVSFASVYLLGLGYSNSSLGIVLAAGNLLGAVLGTELSSQIDRSEKLTASSLMLPLLILQCAAVLPLLLFPVKSAATVVSYTLYICFTIAVNSLNLKLYTDALHHGCRIDYGFARGLGSSAYVLLSMLLAHRLSSPIRVIYHFLSESRQEDFKTLSIPDTGIREIDKLRKELSEGLVSLWSKKVWTI